MFDLRRVRKGLPCAILASTSNNLTCLTPLFIISLLRRKRVGSQKKERGIGL
jgi:hypothetical protein